MFAVTVLGKLLPGSFLVQGIQSFAACFADRGNQWAAERGPFTTRAAAARRPGSQIRGQIWQRPERREVSLERQGPKTISLRLRMDVDVWHRGKVADCPGVPELQN